MSYQEKLRHHYHELTHEEKHRYQEEDRASFSLEERFFFEGCLLIPGQMHLAERRALYNTILQYKPIHCLEIGTNMGGAAHSFWQVLLPGWGQAKSSPSKRASLNTNLPGRRTQRLSLACFPLSHSSWATIPTASCRTLRAVVVL